MSAKKISQMMMFETAQVAVFDENKQQIPELQISLLILWAERAKSLGYEIDGLIIEGANGLRIRFYEFDHDGEQGINWEIITHEL